MSKHRRVEDMSEIWVKRYVNRDGEISISLVNDEHHRELKNDVDSGAVEEKEV